ncbi:MAG: S41 family peptidase [Lysobacteraceae bacterium]|jgi:carboxyl-terminal processing protease|nr:S41 family peptidase [Silanimonas sp.]
MRRLLFIPPVLMLVAALAQAQGAAPTASTPSTDPLAPAPSAAVPIEDIERFVEVFRRVQSDFVDPIDDRALMRAATRALLADLDPHSAYLPAASAADLRGDANGLYDGIGVEVEVRPDRSLKVIGAIDGSPAQRAGLRTGDVIVAVDGRPVGLRRDDEPSRALRGPAGTSVRLTLLRPGEALPRDVRLVRESIALASVSGRLLEPGHAYVRIAYFEGDTAEELKRVLADLKARAGGRLAGVVLDLRNNPGGLLTTAIECADQFLEGGLIASTRGRSAVANTVYRATPGDLLDGAPMAVLIDVGTASSAEVLAGALRDQRRALLLGSRSFGKGSVQSVIDLGNGDALKLTTARYYTPSGRSIQAAGILPDVVLPGTAIRGLREQDLPVHLAGDAEVVDGYANGVIVEGEGAIAEALRRLKQAAAARAARRTPPRG